MSDAVQQIKDRLNILDVISPYVELHKAGKNFKGKSPFSAEKTPSFYVSPDRGMYYCFSTSQGGDMFTFIQAMEGVDFKEALKILAQKAGVELVPEDPKQKSERDRVYAALEAATVFYQEELTKEPEALAYLQRRGLKPETIAKWRIGFAPGPPKRGWRETKEALSANGYTAEELFKAGLIKSAEGGKEPFDVFRDRVMFPLFEQSGKVVAFSGRILHPDDKAPKYVNSPETQLYKKSELLFGYDKAKHGIRHLNFSLIVEGQFDVVMCHQAGYSNAVAVSGTALTLQHVQLLERLSERVVLALDADRAGIAAMKKAADVMLRRGLDVKVAEMPLGQDPADMIVADPNAFRKVVGSSVHVIDFLLHVLRREVSDDRSFKLKVRDEVLPFVLLLPNRIDQEHFVGNIAGSIGTTPEAVRYELERRRDRDATDSDRYRADASDRQGAAAAEEKVTADGLTQHQLFLEAAVAILEPIPAQRLKVTLSDLSSIAALAAPAETETAGVTFKLEQQFAMLPPLAVAEEVVARLNQFKLGLVRKRLSELRGDLLRCEDEGDDAAVSATLSTIKIYEDKRREPPFVIDDIFANDSGPA